MKTLCLLLTLSLAAPAFASEPMEDAKALLEKNLVDGLRKRDHERARFSRAVVPPRERRVRITSEREQVDASGKAFFTFSMDVRFGAGWKEGQTTGCVYVQSGEAFVHLGDEYRPSETLLGKKTTAVKGVCEAAPTT